MSHPCSAIPDLSPLHMVTVTDGLTGGAWSSCSFGVLCGVEHGEPGSLLLVARPLWAGANGSLHTCSLVGALVLS